MHEVKHFTVLLSSPCDVLEERARAIEVLRGLRCKPRDLGWVALSVVAWDDLAAPTPAPLDVPPQLTVDDYNLRPCSYAK